MISFPAKYSRHSLSRHPWNLTKMSRCHIQMST